MKKRSAMLIAGAAVAVLLAASAALSLGLLGAGSAVAGGDRATPRVRTIERTVTIHKKQSVPRHDHLRDLTSDQPHLGKRERRRIGFRGR